MTWALRVFLLIRVVIVIRGQKCWVLRFKNAAEFNILFFENPTGSKQNHYSDY
ncbi:hypothetical protein Scep_019189 [Stephania cephalantha]|uniref:Uncharacterized protein n=1 Tax=Stephania cephalantha TaxID=152367 RepID=A0AAP0NN06_9MAGN